MTVYVGEVGFGNTATYHLYSDNEVDLHKFALRLGVTRDQFREPPQFSWKRYDIPYLLRNQAVLMGAAPIGGMKVHHDGIEDLL